MKICGVSAWLCTSKIGTSLEGGLSPIQLVIRMVYKRVENVIPAFFSYLAISLEGHMTECLSFQWQMELAIFQRWYRFETASGMLDAACDHGATVSCGSFPTGQGRSTSEPRYWGVSVIKYKASHFVREQMLEPPVYILSSFDCSKAMWRPVKLWLRFRRLDFVPIWVQWSSIFACQIYDFI